MRLPAHEYQRINTKVISLTIYKGHWNRDLRDKENVIYLFLLRTSILNDGKDELSLGAPAELKRIKIEYVQTIVCRKSAPGNYLFT